MLRWAQGGECCCGNSSLQGLAATIFRHPWCPRIVRLDMSVLAMFRFVGMMVLNDVETRVLRFVLCRRHYPVVLALENPCGGQNLKHKI